MMPRPLQMRALTVEGAIRHGPDRLAEGYDDLVEGAERPELERPLSRGRGSAARRRAYVAFVRTRKVLLEIFAHILPQNRIYLPRWRTNCVIHSAVFSHSRPVNPR
jgi:hypothetical protein